MRQVGSADELSRLLATPLRGYAVGLLPPDVAPPEAVVWFRPVTVAQAKRAIAGAMLERGPDYEAPDAMRAILLLGVEIDPQAFLAGEGEPECDEARLRPLWASLAEVAEYGDPSVAGSAAWSLWYGFLMATGFVEPPVIEPPADVQTSLESLRHRGRWVVGSIPQDDEAALWVRPYSEGERHQAAMAANAPLPGDRHEQNPAAYWEVLLSFIVRTTRGGPPLLTVTEAGALPIGTARSLELAATNLDLIGGRTQVRAGFRRAVSGPAAEGAGEAAGVVCGGEAGAGAGGTGDQPASPDGQSPPVG